MDNEKLNAEQASPSLLGVRLRKDRNMSAESLDHVVSGALFDFAGFLTTRKERIICSAEDNAVPVADALKEFMELRGVDIDCDPMFDLWPCRMANGKCKPFTE